MGEHIPMTTPEHHVPSAEAHVETVKSSESAAEHAQQAASPEDQIDTIRRTIEESSAPKAVVEQAALKGGTSDGSGPTYVNKELKDAALHRTLRHLQRELPRTQRLLSKTIHQPAIRRVSAATGQTVARPSGLLGGGLCAFVGSLIYLYLAKHIGFTYNYLLFFVLFVGGFVLGVVLELLISVALRAKRP
jgi:hypothetical protein